MPGIGLRPDSDTPLLPSDPTHHRYQERGKGWREVGVDTAPFGGRPARRHAARGAILPRKAAVADGLHMLAQQVNGILAQP
jgi:hypothetical protein